MSGEALQAARGAAGLAALRLHLGCAETPATYLLPDLLRELRRRHPELDVRLTVGNAARVLAVTVSGEVDLALLTDRERHPSLEGETFRDDRFVVVVAADDAVGRRGTASPSPTLPRGACCCASTAPARAPSWTAPCARRRSIRPRRWRWPAWRRSSAWPRPASAWRWSRISPWSAKQAEGRLHVLELETPANRLAYRLLRHKDKLPAPGIALFREVLALRKQGREDYRPMQHVLLSC